MTDMLEFLRLADPLDPDELASWPSAATAQRIRRTPLHSGPVTPRNRGRRVVAIGLALAVAGSGGIAVAAAILSAPDAVKAHLAELDRGMPADLRYNPDLDHARAVATVPSGVLYLADLANGGYCLEIASVGGQPRGATCVPADQFDRFPLDVTAPLPEGTAPLLIGGRASLWTITQVEVRYADGTHWRTRLGVDRTWLLEVSEAKRASALGSGVDVTGLDQNGGTVAVVNVPPLRDDDPLGTRHDQEQPLVLNTISDESDRTLVLGVTGQVNLMDVTLEVQFPDSTRLPVRVAGDGSFNLRFAPDRQDDFARTPGRLVALRGGAVVASTPIGSLAAWRARQG